MNKNYIQLIKATDGSWVQMIINGRVVFQGHSIPEFIWLDVLADTGFDVLPDLGVEPEEFQ